MPLGEPTEPRPAEWKPGVPYPPGKDAKVVRAAIHPAIGVARVGNSPAEYFIGPEVTDPAPEKPGFYRDAAGALEAPGRAVPHLRVQRRRRGRRRANRRTRPTIRWTVHVANRKAAWYQWHDGAWTSPRRPAARSRGEMPRSPATSARGWSSMAGRSRSAGRTRRGLRTSSAESSWASTSTSARSGRTKRGGYCSWAAAVCPRRRPGARSTTRPIRTAFINADGWYDDMSDGPVTAEVTIEGRPIPVESAWVRDGPAELRPERPRASARSTTCSYDLYIQAGWLQRPARGIVPRRRVPDPAAAQRTPVGEPAASPRSSATAGRTTSRTRTTWRNSPVCPEQARCDLYAELRRQVFNSFRNPDGTDNNQLPWPWIYGDAMDVPPANTPRQNASVSPTQYLALMAWAAGKFVPDRGPAGSAAATASRRCALQDQPAMLDRAALDVLPGRRVPPGVRGDLADPAPDDVPRPVPHPPPPARRVRTGLRVDADPGRSPCR